MAASGSVAERVAKALRIPVEDVLELDRCWALSNGGQALASSTIPAQAGKATPEEQRALSQTQSAFQLLANSAAATSKNYGGFAAPLRTIGATQQANPVAGDDGAGASDSAKSFGHRRRCCCCDYIPGCCNEGCGCCRCNDCCHNVVACGCRPPCCCEGRCCYCHGLDDLLCCPCSRNFCEFGGSSYFCKCCLELECIREALARACACLGCCRAWEIFERFRCAFPYRYNWELAPVSCKPWGG